ncbi:MAG: phage holin family protein [Patescibacteria group bacterium]
MKLIGKFLFHIFSNAIALIVAAYFVVGFTFSGAFLAMLITATILTLINVFIKPLLSFFMGPLIILTLGLFYLVINAITLYILDIFSAPLTIQGYLPLLYGTLIVTIVNVILEMIGRRMYKKD